MWEILSDHTTRNLLTQATIMSSHATIEKRNCPLEGKCRTENIIYKYIAWTSGHPNKVYLGTARFKKKDIITISVLLKMRREWIKLPWQSIFGNKSRDIT